MVYQDPKAEWVLQKLLQLRVDWAHYHLTLEYCIRVYFTPRHFKKSSLSGPWQQLINHLYSFSLMIDLVEGGCVSVISRY